MTDDLPGLRVRSLEESYRFDDDLATVLSEYVYHADDVDLTSTQQRELSPALRDPTATPGLNATLHPTASLVMVVHDDTTARMTSPIETELIGALTDAIPDDTDLSTGVVTPHNAQRGHLTDALPEDIEVNTVEGYQGGERDIIIVSGTVADPDLAASEDRFLLDRRRLTVAISRARYLSIVVCSHSLLSLVPTSTTDLDTGPSWARLFTIATDDPPRPAWSGPIEDYLDQQSTHPETTVAVYPATT